MVVDGLYYPEGRDTADTFDFSDEVLRQALLNIYSKDFHPATDIEVNLFNEVWKTMDKAAREGFGSMKGQDPDRDFFEELCRNNGVFAAFKVHRAQNDMARLLLDSDGNLKPFEQWEKEVMPIASHQMRHWLRTEYDTAVIRAHQAADWRQFEREKDILPNLKWMPSTSVHPGADHRAFWGTIRPVDDPFWSQHRPGDRWNCKCSLASTDEKPTPVPEGTPENKPQPGLENNPGKGGAIFADSHPYFPANCKKCTFYKKSLKNSMKAFFVNRAKDCYNCPYIKGCIDRMTVKRTIEEAAFKKKQEVKDNGMMPKYDKTRCDGVVSGIINRTNKVRNTLLKHCHHDYDVEAAVYIWNHPEELRFIRVSPLGEGKDMSTEEAQANIRKKIHDLGFILFHQYEFDYAGRTFEVKMALCKKGYEQFYALKEK